MTETMIYWITRLDGICKFCDVVQTIALVFTVIGICILLAVSILKHISESEEDAKIAKWYLQDVMQILDSCVMRCIDMFFCVNLHTYYT